MAFMRRSAWQVACAALPLLFCAPAALACPNCKNALPSGNGTNAELLSGGFFISYIVMTAVPFLLAAGIAFLLWRASRPAPSRPPAPLEKP